MRRNWLLMGVGLIAAMLAVAAVACDDDEPSEEEATAQLCEDLVALEAADEAFDDLSAASTIDEIRATNEAYSKALGKAVDSAGGVAAARAQPIEDAYADLDQAIDDIPGDATIVEALASIADELLAVGSAYDEAFASLDCP
jgi:hypothetical protein